jgi:8-oxo-dGTP pyrophosphatase MutT (NUDIX family)
MQKHQIWTDEETELLKKHWKDYTQRELHDKFLPEKTPVQICQKKMHMKLVGRRKWSEEERAILIEHGADYTHKEMVKKFLPNKTPRQVVDMRKYLGVSRRAHKAAGFVVCFLDDKRYDENNNFKGKLKFLLIKGGFGWEFPKGHIEEGESRLEAAKRETKEETGLSIETIHPTFKFLSKYLVTIDYKTRKKLSYPIPKTVTYFMGVAPNKDVKLSFEHSEFGWFSYKEAFEKLSKNKKEVLNAARFALKT